MQGDGMRKNHKKPIIIMLCCMGLLLGGIFGYLLLRAHMMRKYIGAAMAGAQTVSTEAVRYALWQPKAQAVGTIRAVHGVDVSSEVAGQVRNIYFSPGKVVKKGDLLVDLNTDVASAELQSRKASADLAKITYKRDVAQYAVHAVSRATVDIAQADLKNKTAQVGEQEAVIAQKRIHAPFDGKIGISFVNVGQYLNPGDKIVTLQALDPVYMDFYLPQNMLAHLALNQKVMVRTDAFPQKTFFGKITTIGPKLDETTRNVPVEAVLKNPQQLLLPGMFTRVSVNTGAPQKYLTISQTAVSFNPYGQIVFVVHAKKDNKGQAHLYAKQIFVKTGKRRGDQIAVLEGLQAGDQVITAGALKLANGAQIQVNNTVLPTNEEHPTHLQEQ